MSLQNAYVRLNVKWAGKLGSPYAQYRMIPESPFADTFAPSFGGGNPAGISGILPNPVASQYLIGSLPALFDASISLAFNSPNKFANSLFAAILNPTAVRPLDYLVGGQGTFFVASTEPLKPILCIQCNRVCTFSRPTPMAPSPGYYGNGNPAPRRFYGGDNPSSRTPLVTDVPCSQLQGTKGERSAAEQLPTDSRMQWSEIIVPAFPGLLLRQGDHIVDDLGRNFITSACELTDQGWRLTAELVDA